MKKLSLEQLRKECDLSLMSCETTEELSPLEGIIGQERALKAIRFGLDIKERGFNIYVSGVNRPTGLQNDLLTINRHNSRSKL